MRFKVGKMVIFVLFLQNNHFLYILVVKKKRHISPFKLPYQAKLSPSRTIFVVFDL